MSERHSKRPARHHEEDESGDVPDRVQKPKEGTRASAAAEDVLDDIDQVLDVLDEFDRVLKLQCGFAEDEEVSPEVLENTVARLVYDFQQKGGQ